MTAGVPRSIADLDVPEQVLLEQLRTSLPLDDPDRHDLDVEADRRFAALAPGRPVDPDFVASVAAGHVAPVVWDDCEPEFVAPRVVADVQTGGAL